ncbi:MAG TPA: Zn-dependent hydrolase [Pararhizobium sp.]|nr:Zn-dependent hydrolase [Pararhizobium sp.]
MADRAQSPRINSERLRALLDGVNAFGHSAGTGGFNRPAFSDADMAVRRWFAGQMKEAGLVVRRDGAGNLFGRLGGEGGPVVMIGSHLDTVPEGGAFDGALGACIALESVRALRDAGIEPAIPIEVVATSDEEGRFGGMLGSQAIAGQIDHAWIEQAVDADGLRLSEAMAAQGLDPLAIPNAARPAGMIRAFLELHVEQGPVLEAQRKSVGIVEAVSGICHWQVTLVGRANHSGTTPMDMRSDAFAGLAEIAAMIPTVIRDTGGEQSRVTIGKVRLFPDHPHTIPGRAVFNLIIRDVDEDIMQAMASVFRDLIGRISGKHRLEASIDEMSWLAPAALDAGIASILETEAKRLGLAYMRMPSGAGHDAQTMQAICPSALIFVPSRAGISHAPEEWTDWADIENGAALYLATLCRLAGAGEVPSIT